MTGSRQIKLWESCVDFADKGKDVVPFLMMGFDGDGQVIRIESKDNLFFLLVIYMSFFYLFLEFLKTILYELGLILVNVLVEGVFEGEVNSSELEQSVQEFY